MHLQPEGKLMDQAVSSVFISANKPEEVVLSVSRSDIQLLRSGSREVSVPVAAVIKLSYWCISIAPISSSVGVVT